MKKRHGSVICRGAFCDGMGCILHHPLCGWFPFFCGKRQGVAAKPPQVTISCPPDTRQWTKAVCQLSDRPLLPPLMNLYRFQRWQVAAALSAAVTTTKPIGDRPHSQAEPTPKDRPTPNASRSSGEGGLGERRFSQRSGLSPGISPHLRLFGEGAPGRGASLQRSSPPSQSPFTLYFFH